MRPSIPQIILPELPPPGSCQKKTRSLIIAGLIYTNKNYIPRSAHHWYLSLYIYTYVSIYIKHRIYKYIILYYIILYYIILYYVMLYYKLRILISILHATPVYLRTHLPSDELSTPSYKLCTSTKCNNFPIITDNANLIQCVLE